MKPDNGPVGVALQQSPAASLSPMKWAQLLSGQGLPWGHSKGDLGMLFSSRAILTASTGALPLEVALDLCLALATEIFPCSHKEFLESEWDQVGF